MSDRKAGSEPAGVLTAEEAAVADGVAEGMADGVADGVADEATATAAAASLMRGAPPFDAGCLVILANWQDPPFNRWAFQHVRELIPTARIRRGTGPVWELEREAHDLGGVRFEAGAVDSTVGQLLDDTQTDAFLVIHRDRIVAEEYRNGMTADTPHLLMSVSKSVTSAVVGALVRKGSLDVEARVTGVVPELAGSSFEGATVQQLLDMRTGTSFNENYDDPSADVRRYEQVYLWRPRASQGGLPADALSYYMTLRNDGPHGGPFRYRSILTDVLAWVLERAAGDRFHELVARELWQAMGAEHDAEVTLDARGNPMADGGISATLRDLGRLGLLHLKGGKSGLGSTVFDAGWVGDLCRGAPDGAEAFTAGDNPPGFPAGSHYRNYWWVRDADAGFYHASGIYGQHIFVHVPTETVVVKLSSWPTPLDSSRTEAMALATVAIGEALE